RAAEVAGPGPRPAAAPGVRASLRGTQDDPSVRRGRYQAGSAAADAAYQAPSIRDGGDNLGVEMNRAVGCAQLQGDVGIHQSEGDGSVGGVDVVRCLREELAVEVDAAVGRLNTARAAE